MRLGLAWIGSSAVGRRGYSSGRDCGWLVGLLCVVNEQARGRTIGIKGLCFGTLIWSVAP